MDFPKDFLLKYLPYTAAYSDAGAPVDEGLVPLVPLVPDIFSPKQGEELVSVQLARLTRSEDELEKFDIKRNLSFLLQPAATLGWSASREDASVTVLDAFEKLYSAREEMAERFPSLPLSLVEKWFNMVIRAHMREFIFLDLVAPENRFDLVMDSEDDLQTMFLKGESLINYLALELRSLTGKGNSNILSCVRDEYDIVSSLHSPSGAVSVNAKLNTLVSMARNPNADLVEISRAIEFVSGRAIELTVSTLMPPVNILSAWIGQIISCLDLQEQNDVRRCLWLAAKIVNSGELPKNSVPHVEEEQLVQDANHLFRLAIAKEAFGAFVNLYSSSFTSDGLTALARLEQADSTEEGLDAVAQLCLAMNFHKEKSDQFPGYFSEMKDYAAAYGYPLDLMTCLSQVNNGFRNALGNSLSDPSFSGLHQVQIDGWTTENIVKFADVCAFLREVGLTIDELDFQGKVQVQAQKFIDGISPGKGVPVGVIDLSDGQYQKISDYLLLLDAWQLPISGLEKGLLDKIRSDHQVMKGYVMVLNPLA